jgi:5-methylcytosine-specific restriction protein A
MHLLYYWKRENYVRDLDYGAGYHLNQSNPLMHEIAIGESLWAFTRDAQGRYVLAAELITRAKTHNPPNFRYGRYRVWSDLSRSKYFETDNQPSVEHVIRQLSPRTQARYLGQSFQGNAAVRKITQQDHQVLSRLSSDLKIEPRARILPEERLEAALLLGDREAVYNLVRKEESGVAEERQKYLYQKAPTRNRALADRLQSTYSGQCQICCWDPRDDYNRNLCHAHHIHWLSRGGDDELENLMLVCPNHHEAIHKCDAQFDYRDGQYDFGTHCESISLNKHLPLWNN